MTRRYANESIPPEGNPAVARIMRERGIGRTRAYKLWKEQQAAAIDTSDIQPSQRLAVMSALMHDEQARRGVRPLVKALHRESIKIDQHDAAKTLWALQKQRWVTFREKASTGDLYGIRIRPEGYDGYRALYQNGRAAQVETAPPPVVEQAPVEAIIEPEAIEPEVGEAIIKPTKFDWRDFSLEYPVITALRERADKVGKLMSAAKLLEDAEETDMALAVMEKASLSPLESEVIGLLGEVFE